jgi:transcriptional regulator with XRE-family HTH domain
VRRCRSYHKLSRRSLAEKSGVSVSTISRLENEGVATLGVLIKLATALGVTDSLLGIFPVPDYKSMDEFLNESN